MTAVVLVGDFPSTGILRTTVAQRLVLDGSEDTAPTFIAQMEYALRQRGAVLVIYPEWKGARTRRLVRLARAALLTDRIAGVALDLPPIALSLVADQLTFASSYVRPAVLVSLAHRLCESHYAGAWVNSVAGLEHIRTSLGAHVSSYLPGGAFAVTAGPGAGVHRITAVQPLPPSGTRPTDPVLLLFSDMNGDTEWLRHKLQPAVAAVSATMVAPQPLGAEYWGTKKYVEFVAFSGHPQAVQMLLSGCVFRPCGWCGEPIALPQCPLCLMAQADARPEPVPERVPEPVPEPAPASEPEPESLPYDDGRGGSEDPPTRPDVIRVPQSAAPRPTAPQPSPSAGRAHNGAGADRAHRNGEADEIAERLPEPAPRQAATPDPALGRAPEVTFGDGWPRVGTVAFHPRDRSS